MSQRLAEEDSIVLFPKSSIVPEIKQNVVEYAQDSLSGREALDHIPIRKSIFGKEDGISHIPLSLTLELRKEDPFQGLKLDSCLTLGNELSEETHVLTKQKILLGKDTQVNIGQTCVQCEYTVKLSDVIHNPDSYSY
ncbi:hypothetical protein MG293_000473 [Ovis ammon polii]|uniref:Uncharacterized protein n=1 Tax=Ovis ammon polii TaxID=230172 RepID=A0AAD4YHE3_OVIAM|nr:hypothetical protein MG293_000473 [Ovis ammon polii]